MSEKWETVPSRSLKKSVQQKTNGASKKHEDTRSGQYDAPKVPVFEESSQYDALTPRDQKDRNQRESEAKKKDESASKPKSGIPRPQKKDGGTKKSGQKPRLENLVPTISREQFEEFYSKSQTLFKDSPLIWLKELTGKLNSKLDEIPQSDPTFSDHPDDFPSSLLKSDVKKVFNKSIRECSVELLLVFQEQLIQSVISEMGKGLSVYGYQIVAQLLAKYKPDIFFPDSDKCNKLIVNNKNVPAKCLAVMWIVGQGGCNDFRSGLKVWTSLMLPVMGIKTLAPYSIAYLGRILQKAGSKIEQGYNVIDMKNYFLLLDGVFTGSNNLQAPLLKRLKEYYPILKKLAFGKNPEKTLQKFFPSFVIRLTNDGAKPELQREALENIVLCLTSDPHCFHIWKQIYAQHLNQTSVVLNYLADNWQQNALLGLNYKMLRETVKSFVEANNKFSRNTPGLEACISACARFEEVHASNTAGGVSTFTLVLILSLLTVGGLIAFDNYQNGGYKGSRTQKLLADAGIDVFVSKISSQVVAYTSMAAAFLSKNVPKWTETALIYIEPMLDVAWNYAIIAIQYIADVTEPLRVWMAENIPRFIDWVIMHPGWEVVSQYLTAFWLIIQPYIETMSQYVNAVLDKAAVLISQLTS